MYAIVEWTTIIGDEDTDSLDFSSRENASVVERKKKSIFEIMISQSPVIYSYNIYEMYFKYTFKLYTLQPVYTIQVYSQYSDNVIYNVAYPSPSVVTSTLGFLRFRMYL